MTKITVKIGCIFLCKGGNIAFLDEKKIQMYSKMDSRKNRIAPSLIDLCIKTAIDNLRYLGDVGETDIDLLGRILPHCTIDQLMHIEKSTEVR